jgi:hypothetical protein
MQQKINNDFFIASLVSGKCVQFINFYNPSPILPLNNNYSLYTFMEFT